MSQSPYQSVCAISVKSWDSRAGKQLEGTGSGILIDPSRGLVLTHASILSSFATLVKPLKLSSFPRDGVLRSEEFPEQVVATVFLPAKQSALGEGQGEQGKYRPEMLNCNLTDEESLYESYSATVRMLFVCKHLKTALAKLVPKNSWQFAEEISPSQNLPESKEKRPQEVDELHYMLLPCFVLLKLRNWFPVDTSLTIRSSLDNRQGDPVEICASPFGALSPEVFLNSHSRGIISNLAGRNHVLILTDARCIPGSDGGALFYCQGKDRILTGIMVASLCWKNNEWIGLSFACAITEVLASLKGFLHMSPNIPLNEGSLTEGNPGFRSATVSALSSLVPLIVVGSSWGSGVILDSTTGTILTCSHVVKTVDREKVLIHYLPSAEQEVARVISRNTTSPQFDLAVLQVSRSCERNTPHLPLGTAQEGDVVFVIGHGVFGLEHGLPPTLTVGVVSKVITMGTVPVMIQTTCAVHAGASGGAVVNTKGHLVAIVVCNSKDTVSGACYPHVNMCIPMVTVAPILQQYLERQAADGLSALSVKSAQLQRIWSIGSQAALSTSSHL